jgi:hypothetical protein
MIAAASHNHHSRRSIFRKFDRRTPAPASGKPPGVLLFFVFMNRKCRLFPIAPAHRLPQFRAGKTVQELRKGLGFTYPASNLGKQIAK